MASVMCQEWSVGFCSGQAISMRVVPRSMIRSEYVTVFRDGFFICEASGKTRR